MNSASLNVTAIVTAATGQWRGLLDAAAIQLPTGRHHGPCPVCGGRDRFRFDDKDGRGTFICNQCGAGDGLTLYCKATGQSIKQALPSLASMLGLSGSMSATDLIRIEYLRQKAAEHAAQQRKEEASQREAVAELAGLMFAEALEVDAAKHPYLARKGYAGFPVLILARDYQHRCNGKRYTYHAGCLLHDIINENGDIIGAELVLDNGRKTSLAGGSKAGACLIPPLDEAAPIKHAFTCEGVASGYAARELLGGNACGFAGLSKNGLLRAAQMTKKFNSELTPIICGDVGAEREAEQAAAAVGGMVSFPPSGDWDDYRREVTV